MATAIAKGQVEVRGRRKSAEAGPAKTTSFYTAMLTVEQREEKHIRELEGRKRCKS